MVEMFASQPNTYVLVASCPARIGDNHRVMEDVHDITSGKPWSAKVDLVFSSANSAASAEFYNMQVAPVGGSGGAAAGAAAAAATGIANMSIGGGGGGGGTYPQELVAWCQGLELSETKVDALLSFLCSEDMGFTKLS